MSRIAIIHPIESAWLLHGPHTAESYNGINAMDKHFGALTHFLLGHHLDLEYVCEEQLPTLYRETDHGFAVGEMTYDAVIVPKCITMRATTVERLSRFAQNGGRVIFTDAAPTHIDGLPSDVAASIPATYTHGVNDQLLAALADLRTVSIADPNGAEVENLLYQILLDATSPYRSEDFPAPLFQAFHRKSTLPLQRYRGVHRLFLDLPFVHMIRRYLHDIGLC